MLVRELVAGEEQIWRELRLAALLDSPTAFGSHAEESQHDDDFWRRRIAHNAADPDAASLVVEIDGRAVGLAVCRRAPEDGSLVHVFSMWVQPDVRGRGAGRTLIDRCISWARTRGAGRIELAVTEGNEAGMALYLSAGFVDSGRRESLREGSDVQVIIMRRDL